VRDGTAEARPKPGHLSIAGVMVALAAVKTTGAEATLLETGVQSRTDRGHYARAFRATPCRHGRPGDHAGPGFRKDIPFLRLLIGSKAREVVEFVIVSHGVPPVGSDWKPELWQTWGQPSRSFLNRTGSPGSRVPHSFRKPFEFVCAGLPAHDAPAPLHSLM
jgi:hypothetical protein